MKFSYSGFTGTVGPLLGVQDTVYLDSFRQILFPGLTDLQIGWGYFLFWSGRELTLLGAFLNDHGSQGIKKIPINPESHDSCKKVAVGRESLIILSEKNNIWKYNIYKSTWSRVPNFLSQNSNSEAEYPEKILQAGGTIVLTNLGRVFNVPVLVDMPKRTKFIDIACGFDHTILLSDNGDIYSMGMGTRGQLGHQDLEDCDSPRLIEALAGLKVVQISAAGWHSAVITDQGDLYTWGWNTSGELGVGTKDTKVIAVPTLINFTDENDKLIEKSVKSVQCGNKFTICVMADDDTIWGCGSNKYGQLGLSPKALEESQNFVKLHMPEAIVSNKLKEVRCGEWGTLLVTD